MKGITRPVCIMSLCALLVACGNPNQRLDEYVFYNGPQFKLKVVRFYRNIPFSLLGEQAIVMCQSKNTDEFPAHDRQDAGWRLLGAGDAQNSKSAEQAAKGVKDDYVVFDDHTLIGKMSVFNISFDACGHFINWNPGRLPKAIIKAREKPDSCAPKGPVDCRYHPFQGEHTPRYEQIRVPGNGQVSFTASSTAFRDVGMLRVQTRNNGAVWHVETVALDKVNCHQAGQGELPSGKREYPGVQGELPSGKRGYPGVQGELPSGKRGYPGGEETTGMSRSSPSAQGCADQPVLKPGTVASIPVSLLEYGLEDSSLMDWLESTLPNHSMVVWPDVLGSCGDQQTADKPVSSVRCTEIRFNDIEGNSGTLYITMNQTPDNRPGEASFHSGVYVSGDKSQPVGSLAGLRELLSTAAE